MSEQRRSEITVGTTVAEWGEEMVAQWNVLGDTIARSVQQRARMEQEHGQQERLANASELERMRAALAESDARVTAVARESAARLDATRREYEMKLALLQQELEQRGQPYEGPGAVAETTHRQQEGGAASYEETVWVEQETLGQRLGSKLTGLGSAVGERWSRLRSGPYLMPATGFLAGLAVMVSLYPLLHRPSAAAAKESVTAKPVAAAPSAVEPTQEENVSRANSNSGSPTLAQPEPTPAAGQNLAATPSVAAEPTPKAVAPDGYAVLLAGGRLLTPDKPGDPSASYEARLALRAGYATTALYQKNDRYMAAVLFSNRQEAEKSLQSINADFDNRWKGTSSIVPVGEWCRAKSALAPVVINGVEVAVWSCNKTPS